MAGQTKLFLGLTFPTPGLDEDTEECLGTSSKGAYAHVRAELKEAERPRTKKTLKRPFKV